MGPDWYELADFDLDWWAMGPFNMDIHAAGRPIVNVSTEDFGELLRVMLV